MNTVDNSQQYNQIARVLISRLSVSGNINIVGTLGFFLALMKQGKLTDSYDIDSFSSVYDVVLELDSSHRIGINDVCNIMPRKDNILDIIRTVGTIYDLNYAELFEVIISAYVSDNGRKQGDFYQPKELTHLATALLKGKKVRSVYNPFAGIASYQLDNPTAYYYSQEINKQTWLIGKIRLLLHGIDSDFVCTNSIDHWEGDKRKFDAVIATPPFGMQIGRESFIADSDRLHFSRKGFDSFILEKSLNSISHNGIVLSVVALRFLFSNNDQLFKKYLINRGCIQTIVLLPSNIFYGTTIPAAILKLAQMPNSGVLMVDGTSFFKKEGRQNVLQYEELLNAIHKLDSKHTRFISNEEIAKNDYNLSPSLYLNDPSKSLEVPDGFKLEKLGKLISPYKGNRANSEEIRFVRGKDLAEDRFSFDKTFEELKPEEPNGYCSVLDRDLLLILRIGNLKPTYFHYSSKFKVACNQNILAFELNPDVVYPQYLVNELSKEYISQQVAVRSNGIMPSISTKDLLEIEVLVPVDSDNQKIVFESDKRNYSLQKARKLGLEEIIAKMKAEYLDEIRMRKHDMKPYLRELRSAYELTKHYVDNNLGDIVEKLDGLLSKQKMALDNLSCMIERLADENVFGVPEKFNIDKYFYDLEVNHPETSNFDIQCDIDTRAMEEHGLIFFDYIDFLNRDHLLDLDPSIEYEPQDLYIKIAPSDFENLVSSIITNAAKHGFIDDSRDDYEIRIDVSIDAKRDMFQIDFRNNGALLPKGVTKERFGLKGERAGSTGGSGIGGYRIKSIVEHYSGDYEIFCEPDKTMPVTIRIYLPIHRSDEKL